MSAVCEAKHMWWARYVSWDICQFELRLLRECVWPRLDMPAFAIAFDAFILLRAAKYTHASGRTSTHDARIHIHTYTHTHIHTGYQAREPLCSLLLVWSIMHMLHHHVITCSRVLTCRANVDYSWEVTGRNSMHIHMNNDNDAQKHMGTQIGCSGLTVQISVLKSHFRTILHTRREHVVSITWSVHIKGLQYKMCVVCVCSAVRRMYAKFQCVMMAW
jgi:hypothetical protein